MRASLAVVDTLRGEQSWRAHQSLQGLKGTIGETGGSESPGMAQKTIAGYRTLAPAPLGVASGGRSTGLFCETEAMQIVYDYMELFQNPKQMRSTSGNCGPVQHEKYSYVA